MTSWITPTEATDITNVAEVTAEQISAAQVVIEIYGGVTTAASAALKPRDLRLIRYAVAYQAVWMPSQVDLLTRMDVDNVNQDGIEYSKGDPDAHILAPLAKQCLLRLSWRRTRSLLPLTPEQALRLRGFLTPGTTLTGAEEFLDDRQTWSPM
jgi:hypothetical protein